jgi:hypothetical protein
MYKTIARTFPVVLFAVVAGQAQTLCSNATLKGYYGVQITGTRPAPSVLSGIQATPGTIEAVAGVVVQIFDGAGGFTQIDNVKGSLSGITFDRPGGGTYSVNGDCSGTFTVLNAGLPPIVNRFVIVDNGQGFLTVVASPQAVMVTATGKKMAYLPSCPVSTAPVLTAATNADDGGSITTSGTIAVTGQGFTPSGGNALVFQRPGVSDIVLSESSNGYFWDYSSGQINASLRGMAAGKWTLTVHSACSASPSNALSVTIQ